MKSRFIPALTGLRGVGAVWVVAYHIFLGADIPIIKHGWIGVDLFFILSGFIISHVHAKDFQIYSIHQHLHFLQLRLARIYPLHVFILVLFALPVIWLPGFATRYTPPEMLDFPHFLASLFLVQNWGVGHLTLWNTPSWSLSAEWLAYLAFPAITIGCSRFIPPRAALSTATCVLASFVLLIQFFGNGNFDAAGKIGVVRVAAEFTTGCLLFLYSSSVQAERLPWKTAAWLALLMIIASLTFRELQWMSYFGFSLLVISVAMESGTIASSLSNRAVLILGEISFSLYLCHWPLIQLRNWCVSRTHLDARIMVILLILAIAVTSWLTWRYVEMPGRRIGRRLSRRTFDTMLWSLPNPSLEDKSETA